MNFLYLNIYLYLVLLLNLEDLVDQEYLFEKNIMKKKKVMLNGTHRLDLEYPFHLFHLATSHLADRYHPLDRDYRVDLVDLDSRHHPKRKITSKIRMLLLIVKRKLFTFAPPSPIAPG
jgi:hypothetical protein